MELLHYTTIEKPVVAEFKDRGSRFIAFAFPISSVADFKQHLQFLKKEHPKAVHHCFAYKLGTDGHVFRVSDDGEPSGTAGKPIMGVIESKQLTNILIVVVRYFGGTLLGVPGLIHAYKTASSLALQIVPFVQKAVEDNYQLQFDYTQMNSIMVVLKQVQGQIKHQDIQLFCQLQIAVPRANKTVFLEKMQHFHQVEVQQI